MSAPSLPIPDVSKSLGLVVKFDGIDGCGKSTLCASVRDRCSSELKVFCTSEFGSAVDFSVGSTAANQSFSRTLRDFALNPEYECDDVERQLLLNAISRRTNRIEIAKSAQTYDLVLVDRSSLSNVAYGVPIDSRFGVLAAIANEGVESTDIVFWIDTPLNICAKRLRSRAQPLDAVELKDDTYQACVREQFQNLAKLYQNVTTLDGILSIAELTDHALSHINIKLQQRTREDCFGIHY